MYTRVNSVYILKLVYFLTIQTKQLQSTSFINSLKNNSDKAFLSSYARKCDWRLSTLMAIHKKTIKKSYEVAYLSAEGCLWNIRLCWTCCTWEKTQHSPWLKFAEPFINTFMLNQCIPRLSNYWVFKSKKAP